VRPGLVIFDCDGVLVETEEIYFNMNRAFIRGRGGDFDLKYYERFIGLSSDLMWRELKEKFGLKESVPELIALEKEHKTRALAAASLQRVAHVADFIQELKKAGVSLSVASSGRKDNVHSILEKIALKDNFSAIVTGEDITRGKPAPDIFLKAAELSGFLPEQSVVIEDSRNGTLGAKAAGMRCVGFINPHSGNQDLSQADLRISSFDDVELRRFFSL
jgi:HAD superfamily hydrolase (TIGR01509 family)